MFDVGFLFSNIQNRSRKRKAKKSGVVLTRLFGKLKHQTFWNLHFFLGKRNGPMTFPIKKKICLNQEFTGSKIHGSNPNCNKRSPH